MSEHGDLRGVITPDSLGVMTETTSSSGFCPYCHADLSVWDPASGPHVCPAPEGREAAALALCREFPQTCAGSGGMGGEGGPCGAHLDTAREVHPDVMPEFIDQVRYDLRRLW